MAYDFNNATILSNLTVYRDQLKAPELILDSVFSAKTLETVRIQSGVKGTVALNIMSSNMVLQAAACGLISGTGSVTFTQKDITVNDIMALEEVCFVGANTLPKYFFGALMPKGTKVEDLTPKNFAMGYIKDKQNKLKDYVEHLAWIGNTSYAPGASGSFSTLAYAQQANGFLYQLGVASASTVSGNGTYSGALTDANAVLVVNGMINAIPQEIADKDLVLFVSLTNFQKIVNCLINNNNYNYTAVDSGARGSWEINYPFRSGLKIIATSGLQNRNDLVLTFGDNLVVGVDGESDEETFDIWYSQDLNSVRFRAMFRLGTQVAQPQYVVWYRG